MLDACSLDVFEGQLTYEMRSHSSPHRIRMASQFFWAFVYALVDVV